MAPFRNIETGEIRDVDPQGAESAELRKERTFDGRFPLWEQTGVHDADPERHASSEEVAARESQARGRVPVSDITADGYGQSSDAARALGQDSALHGAAGLPDRHEEAHARRSSRSSRAPAKQE